MTSRAPYPYEPPGDRQGPGAGPGRPGGGPGRGGRRGRRPRFLPLVVAVWAVLEIWLLIVIGEAAGGFAVLVLLVAGFLIGSAVIKRAGRRAWRRLTEGVQEAQRAQQGGGPGAGAAGGDAAGRERARGRDRAGEERGGNALAMLGGLLLMVPGVLSDVAGLLCLFPPTAALLRRATRGYVGRRAGFAPGSLGDAYQQARRAEQQMRIHRPDGKVVQGEVVDDSADERPDGRRDGPGDADGGGQRR